MWEKAVCPVMVLVPSAGLRANKFNAHGDFALPLCIAFRNLEITVDPPNISIGLFIIHAVPRPLGDQLPVNINTRLLPIICFVAPAPEADAVVVWRNRNRKGAAVS